MKIKLPNELVPYSCEKCRFCDDNGYCVIAESIYKYAEFERPIWCPIKKGSLDYL